MSLPRGPSWKGAIMELKAVGIGGWFRYENNYYVRVNPVRIGGGFFHAYSLSDGQPRFASTSPEPPDMAVIAINKPSWIQ